MIQTFVGVLFLLAALIVLMSAGEIVRLPVVGDVFPLLGMGGTGFLAGLGVLLVARGLYKRKLGRASGAARATLRSGAAAVASTIAILILALALPFMASALNIWRIAGFPVGYYLVAQGAPLLMLIIVFLWAVQEDKIRDGAQEAAGESDG